MKIGRLIWPWKRVAIQGKCTHTQKRKPHNNPNQQTTITPKGRYFFQSRSANAVAVFTVVCLVERRADRNNFHCTQWSVRDRKGRRGEVVRWFTCSAMWLFQGFPKTQFQPLMKTAETSVTQHSPHHWMIVIMVSRDGNNWFPETGRSVLALLWDSCAVAALRHRPLRFSSLHMQNLEMSTKLELLPSPLFSSKLY